MEKHYNFLIDQLKKSMHHVLQGYHEYLNSSQRYYGGKRLYKELSGAKMSTFELDEKFAEIATLTGLPPLASLYDQIMACNMRILHMISEKEAGSADRNGIPKACMEMFDILAERLALMQPPDQHVQRAEISVEDMLNPGFSSELARLYGFPQLVTSPEDRTEATPLMSGIVEGSTETFGSSSTGSPKLSCTHFCVSESSASKGAGSSLNAAGTGRLKRARSQCTSEETVTKRQRSCGNASSEQECRPQLPPLAEEQSQAPIKASVSPAGQRPQQLQDTASTPASRKRRRVECDGDAARRRRAGIMLAEQPQAPDSSTAEPMRKRRITGEAAGACDRQPAALQQPRAGNTAPRKDARRRADCAAQPRRVDTAGKAKAVRRQPLRDVAPNEAAGRRQAHNARKNIPGFCPAAGAQPACSAQRSGSENVQGGLRSPAPVMKPMQRCQQGNTCRTYSRPRERSVLRACSLFG